MSKHTPGPWLIDTEDRDICVQLPNGEWLNVATIGCMDHNGTKYWFGPESWANACLLRSAPDLLEAAIAALEEMRHTNAPRNSFTDAVDALDAAISKARGES